MSNRKKLIGILTLGTVLGVCAITNIRYINWPPMIDNAFSFVRALL